MNSGTPLRHQYSRDFFPDDTVLELPPDNGGNPAYDLSARGSNYRNDYSPPARSSTFPPSFANRNELDRDPSGRRSPPLDPARQYRSGGEYDPYGSTRSVRPPEPYRSDRSSRDQPLRGYEQDNYPQDTGSYPQSTPGVSNRRQPSDSYAPGRITRRPDTYSNGDFTPMMPTQSRRRPRREAAPEAEQTQRRRRPLREAAPEADPMVCKVCHVEECTIPDICQLAKHEGSEEDKRYADGLWESHKSEVEASRAGQY